MLRSLMNKGFCYADKMSILWFFFPAYYIGFYKFVINPITKQHREKRKVKFGKRGGLIKTHC